MKFDSEKFHSYLKTNWISEFHYFTEIDSTSTFLRNQPFIRNGELALSETQSSGRGRRGRTWRDEPYQNLLFSICYRPQITSDFFSLIPLIAAISVAKICQKYLKDVSIKWPNDILINDKKIAGLLVESKINSGESIFIIGIGLNVNQEEFDPEIKNRSTSFFIEKKEPFIRELILASILDELKNYLNLLESNENDVIISEYQHLCSTLNKLVTFELNGETKTSFAKKIQRDGALMIEMGNSEISFHGNEIFHIRDVNT